MAFIADKRLYVTADRQRVVEESDPDAAFLLVAEGGTLSDEEAGQYGLKAGAKPKGAAEPEPEAESKAVKGPPENKGR